MLHSIEAYLEQIAELHKASRIIRQLFTRITGSVESTSRMLESQAGLSKGLPRTQLKEYSQWLIPMPFVISTDSKRAQLKWLER